MLTVRGGSVIGSLLLFFLITNIYNDPIFSLSSSVLLLVYAFEAVKFRIASRALKHLKIQRHIETDKIFVGENLNVKLLAEYSGSKAGAVIELSDSVPYGLQKIDGSTIFIGEIKGPKQLSTSYNVKAIEMGNKSYENIKARLFDRLGLFVIERQFACHSPIKVYPRLPSFHIQNLGRPRLTISLADKGSPSRSLGTEFKGIREYIPGDDYKSIAWKAMAKSATHSPMTREQEQRKRLDVLVIFLTKPSLQDGPLGRRKIDLAVEASLILANYVIKEGFSISFIYTNSSNLTLVSGSIPQLASSLVNLSFEEVPLLKNIDYVNNHIKRRSIIFILTDLPDKNKIDLKPIQSLRFEGHLIYLILLNNPAFFDNLSVNENTYKNMIEIIDKIEEIRGRELILECFTLGLQAYLCTPNNLSIKMIEAFSEARRVPLP